MSDPDVDHAREALATLDHMVVQDIFLTKTAYLADVVLRRPRAGESRHPTTPTRMVQLGRKAIEPPANPETSASSTSSQAHGPSWNYSHPREVFDEMRQCMDSIAGITWERSSASPPLLIRRERGDPRAIPWCSSRISRRPPAAASRSRGLISADERPDDEYPMVLITAATRALAHRRDDNRARTARLYRAEPVPRSIARPRQGGRQAGDIVTWNRAPAERSRSTRARRRHAGWRGCLSRFVYMPREFDAELAVGKMSLGSNKTG